MTFYVGAHITKQKTIVETLNKIKQYGGNALQIFIGNPRSGRLSSSSEQSYVNEAHSVRSYLQTHNMLLFVHSSYVYNLSSSLPYVLKATMKELDIAAQLGARGVVYHTGKWIAAKSKKAGIIRMQEVVRILAHSALHLNILIILETSSGQGTELFPNVQDLKAFHMSLPKQSQKACTFCVDSAHIWAAGITIDECYKSLGHKNISLIQLNNSPKEFGAHVDRHARLLDEDAKISLNLLKLHVSYAKRYNIPVIMETPDYEYKNEIHWVNAVSMIS